MLWKYLYIHIKVKCTFIELTANKNIANLKNNLSELLLVSLCI